MNTLVFDVYKNTVKKTDGFNPVDAENNYTKLLFKFRDDDDWKKCGVITASFFESSDDIIRSEAAITEGALTASFDLPKYLSNKIYVGLTGMYIDDNGKSVTIATNIIGINMNRGISVTDTTNMDVYEKLLNYFSVVRKSTLPVVDIRNFGAVSDNSAFDNAESIQNAIDFAADKKGMVYIPPGLFYVNATISVKNKENLTIINDGIVHMHSKVATDEKKSTTLFSFYKCKNIFFSVGTIVSAKDQTEPPPEGHKRTDDFLGSNIVGVHINNCEDITLDNYTSRKVAAALVIDADDELRSKNIFLKSLKAYETTQPIYGSHFENFIIEYTYSEECSGCGTGDHFVYISEYAKNFTINRAEFIYTEGKYGVAINLRYAGSSADVGDSSATITYSNTVIKDDYDDTKDLDVAYINNVVVKNCNQFISAKAKTKVYVNNCVIEKATSVLKPCFFITEFADLYVNNSKISTQSILLNIPNSSSNEVTFEGCHINADQILSRGANASDTTKYQKKITFDNCQINCNSTVNAPFWLNWGCISDIYIINSKLNTKHTGYVFYVGNENISYKILNNKITGISNMDGDSVSRTSRLIYYPVGTYSPSNNIHVVNCVCYDIAEISLSKNKEIINYNNILFDIDGNALSVIEEMLETKANISDVYSKAEIDEMLASFSPTSKALSAEYAVEKNTNTATVFTKEEVDISE